VVSIENLDLWSSLLVHFLAEHSVSVNALASFGPFLHPGQGAWDAKKGWGRRATKMPAGNTRWRLPCRVSINPVRGRARANAVACPVTSKRGGQP